MSKRLLVLAGGGTATLAETPASQSSGPSRASAVNAPAQPVFGMVPGLIAGLYQRDELAIDLRQLCDLAGVAFVEAEITGLNPQETYLRLRNRPDLHFDWLSLDVGSVSRPSASGVPIKPLEASLAFLEREGASDPRPLRVIGAGAAGLEVVLALRRRWPQRNQQRSGQLDPAIQRCCNRPASP